MKKFVTSLVCLVLLSFGCSKDEEPNVRLRAKNVGTETITMFFVQGETLTFENIGIDETTDYQAWDLGNITPDIFAVESISGRNAGPFIVNYTPEGARLANGSYTMEVDNDALVKFVKD